MNRTRITTLAVAGVALIVALGCGAGAADTGDGGKPISQPSSSVGGKSAAPKTDSKPKYADPKSTEIKLTVKVLEKQCFGTAGCNLTFRISALEYSGAGLDPEAQYEVTYAYKGLEDPVENRLTLYGATLKYEVEESESGQTKRKSDKVTAVVTSVEKM